MKTSILSIIILLFASQLFSQNQLRKDNNLPFRTNQALIQKDDSKSDEARDKNFRLALNGGFGYQVAKTPDGLSTFLKDYIKDLRLGYQFGGEAGYYFWPNSGIGLKSVFFYTSNKIENVLIQFEDNSQQIITLSDDIKISYVGPSYITRYYVGQKKNWVVMGISLGYLHYQNQKTDLEDYKLTGATLGTTIDLGFDLMVSENVAIGLELSVLTGTISKFDKEGEALKLEKGSYESLSRIDVSLGIRFIK